MLSRVEASQDEQQRFHISSRHTSHFHFKKETALLWLELALADAAQLFLRLYRVSALLRERLGRPERTTGDQPETIRCFRHSSFNRLPCSLQAPRSLARFKSTRVHSRQLSGLEKKTSSVAKRSWNGDVSCRKKTRLSSPPSNHTHLLTRKILSGCLCADGCELRVHFHFWLKSKNRTHRRGEEWLHVFTTLLSEVSLAEIQVDVSAVFLVTTSVVTKVLQESGAQYSLCDLYSMGVMRACTAFSVLLSIVKNCRYKCREVRPNLFSLSALWVNIVSPLWLLRLPSVWLKDIKPEEWEHQKCISVSFYSPVLYRQLWGDGKDFIGPRSQCQRARQWAVDAAARRRHLWPCRIGENPYRPVRWGDAWRGFSLP